MGRIHFFKASVQFLPNLKNDVGIDRLQFSPDPKDPQKGGGQQKKAPSPVHHQNGFLRSTGSERSEPTRLCRASSIYPGGSSYAST
jgi:hypothetical protein